MSILGQALLLANLQYPPLSIPFIQEDVRGVFHMLGMPSWRDIVAPHTLHASAQPTVWYRQWGIGLRNKLVGCPGFVAKLLLVQKVHQDACAGCLPSTLPQRTDTI